MIRGIADVLRGAALVLKTPSLYKWLVLPFVLSLAILVGVAWFGYSLAAPGAEAIAGLLPDFLQSLAGAALKALLVVIIAVGSYVVFIAIAALVTTPFCEMLSEAIEDMQGGKPGPDFSLAQLLSDLVVGIVHGLRRVLLYLFSVVVLLLIGALVPVIGPIIALAITAIVTIRFAAFDVMDCVMARKSWSYDQKKSFLRSNRSRTFGLGAATATLAVIPVFGLLAMPFGAAGATLFYLESGARD